MYIHLVWTTRGREPVITPDLAQFLCRFLRAIARKERAYILEIGMVRTHVHLLARIHPTVPVSLLVKRLKGASSAVAHQDGVATDRPVYWAKGYSVGSVSASGLASVRSYLRAQPVRHPEEAIAEWKGDTPEYDSAG
jgi:putative transposase